MAWQFEKTMIASALLTVSGLAAAFGCPPVIDSIWQAGMVEAGTSVATGVTGLVETVATARTINLQLVLSALKVLSKQVDISTSKESAMALGAKQGGAVFTARLQANGDILKTALAYNSATGQGFNPCDELRRSKSVAVAIGEANHDMEGKVLREVDASPGRVVPSVAQVIAGRLADMKGKYCTGAEEKMGFCKKVGAVPGGDVDSSNFFATVAKGDLKSVAKSAFLNHLFGLPHQAPPKSVIKTPAATAFFDAKREDDAVKSVAQNSLKTIQSWTEASGTGSDSVLGALGKKVDTYSGGANYAEWEKNKLSQSERGLLVEYAKMAAAELYMMQLEYQQAERAEANVATLLALRARASGGAASAGGEATQRAAAEKLVK